MKGIFALFCAWFLISCNNPRPASLDNALLKPVENIKATKDQSERRRVSELYCRSHQLPVYPNPNSMFTDAEQSVSIRTKNEVVERALALCYLGLKSEGLEQQHLDEMDERYQISGTLTPVEKAYATATLPTEQQKINANWGYESLHVMLWALSFVDSLSYPDKACDVAADVRIIHELTKEQFIKKARLRSKAEILGQADLILRIDWACVNARVNEEAVPGNLDNDIVTERHKSLNWLINYLGQNWDDVTTDT